MLTSPQTVYFGVACSSVYDSDESSVVSQRIRYAGNKHHTLLLKLLVHELRKEVSGVKNSLCGCRDENHTGRDG